MTVSSQDLWSSYMGAVLGPAKAAPAQDAPVSQLLFELRDALFVIAGTAASHLPGANPQTAYALRHVLDAATQATECARTLAEWLDQAAPGRGAAFDVNARLQALKGPLEARLPDGARLRLRLAGDLWPAEGDAACFDDAVTALVTGTADAMRRQRFAAPIAILTTNLPAASYGGEVRVSVVSDMAWMSEPVAADGILHDVEGSLARHGGRLLRGDRAAGRAVAHIDLRRATPLAAD